MKSETMKQTDFENAVKRIQLRDAIIWRTINELHSLSMFGGSSKTAFEQFQDWREKEFEIVLKAFDELWNARSRQKKVVNHDVAEQFVKKYPALFTEDHWFWIKAIEELLDENTRAIQHEGEKPKVIVFCGSSRFIGQMAILMWEFEKMGNICMGLHYLPYDYCQKYQANADGSVDHIAEQEGIAEQMDELHKRKIDLADEIFVVNVGGYIGDSTRSEIEYATKHGKVIKYLESIRKTPKQTE